MEADQDQIEFKPVEVYDPIQKKRYNVFVEQGDNIEVLQGEVNTDNDEEHLFADDSFEFTQEPNTTWNQNETLALINIFSLHKDKFKHFKVKKDRWKLVSRELEKIGIDKLPQKCEIKWRNLLRTYRSYKSSEKSQGKFEFFNELDDIVSNDPQLKHACDNHVSQTNFDKTLKLEIALQSKQKSLEDEEQQEIKDNVKKRKCTTCKSEKQKRHEERMVLLKRKLDLEERRVKAFEDYLNFLKSSHNTNL